ncbi:MAG: hypothetical protein SR1Q5_03510 [Quinella sp. 1Q5]|nr:hypothetical protein [Quinella sp. 1Q5]
MSLQDAVKDLRRIAKTLDAVKFNPQMNALEKFVDNLEDKVIERQPDKDILNKLLEKFLRGDYDFSWREEKILPQIIYKQEVNTEDVKTIYSLIDTSQERILRRVIDIYLKYHDKLN